MSQDDWVGRSEKMKRMMRSVQAGRIVHALLFTGPHGTGKRTAAAWLARTLVCTGESKPCGVCPGCKRTMSGVHPDISVVRPDEKGTIHVEDIRALIETMGLKPYEAPLRVAVIEQAEQMTESAQNALLKTLETPAGNAVFMLLSGSPAALLPTILSRCAVVRMSPLSVRECAKVLSERGISPQRAELLAGIAQGSVGRALELDADEGYFEIRNRVLESLEMLRGGKSVSEAARMISDKEDRDTVLSIMELWARDLMIVQNGTAPFELADEARLRKSRLNGCELLKAVLRARDRLASNVSWTNVLESMYFEL